MKKVWNSLRTALVIAVTMIVLCGFVYPLALTGVSQLLFPKQANGSLIEIGGKVVGSSLIGQDFEDARFFKGRPSAVGYNTYTAEAKKAGTYAGLSSGSYNYAPSNPDLKKRIEKDIQKFLKANPDKERKDIPMDLITASGSGLDPDITPEAALVQVDGIAKASGLSKSELKAIIQRNTTAKMLGSFGEEHVNVLACNLEIAQKIGIIS